MGSETATGYITQAPLCITYNDDYDTDSLEAWVNGRLMAAMGDNDELEIISKQSGTNAMNFTIQITHSISSGVAINEVLWDGTKAGNERDDTMCDDFEDAYAGSKCANCKDVKTYALFADDSGARALNIYPMLMIIALFVAYA